jgi:hypothetical protein
MKNNCGHLEIVRVPFHTDARQLGEALADGSPRRSTTIRISRRDAATASQEMRGCVSCA